MRTNVSQRWDQVFETLRWFHVTSEAKKKLCSADFKPADDAGPQAIWALDAAKATVQLSSQYMGRGRSKELLDAFGTWFQQEKPMSNQ